MTTKIIFHSSKTREKFANLLLLTSFIIAAGLYFILMFKDQVPLAGWFVIGLLGVVHFFLVGRLSVPTPFDLPIIGLLCLLPISYFISVDQSLSLPKIHGFLLSLIIFYLIVNLVKDLKFLRLAFFALIMLSFGIALMGVLGADWPDNNLPLLNRLPGLLKNASGLLPKFTKFNVNSIAGALVFFIPLLLSFLLDRSALKRTLLSDSSNPEFFNVIIKVLVFFLLIIMLLMLILTQSRGALLGALFGSYIFLVLKNKRFLWFIPIILIFLLVFFFTSAGGSLPRLISILDTDLDNSSLPGRLLAWSNTLYVIQDFPLTGVGIGTFNAVFRDFYALNIFTSQAGFIYQPHNNFLSVAVELGIPALMLYVSIFCIAMITAFHLFKKGTSIIKTLALGLSCGFLAHQVFGITDAFSLGTKMGVIMWIYLGLLAALYVHFNPRQLVEEGRRESFESVSHQPRAESYEQNSFFYPSPISYEVPAISMGKGESARQLVGAGQSPRHLDGARGSATIYHLSAIGYHLIAWLLISLVSHSFANLNIYISLSLAILGGFLLGIFCANLPTSLCHREPLLRSDLDLPVG